MERMKRKREERTPKRKAMEPLSLIFVYLIVDLVISILAMEPVIIVDLVISVLDMEPVLIVVLL